MGSKTYGYIRVSSRDQNEDRQKIAMREFGIPHESVFIDKQSGKDFDRPGYKRLMQKIKPNDTLVIKSIDRLGRNYGEILEQWRFITKEKQTAIVVLDMPMERPEEFEAVYKKWKAGRLSARKAALQLGVTHRTFLKWATDNSSD